MNIRAKLFTFFLFVSTSIIGGSIYYAQLNESVSKQAQGLILETTQLVEQAYYTQSTFSAQLQAWKNILLRGQQSSNYYKHLQDFYHQEREVRRAIESLVEKTVRFPHILFTAQELQQTHLKLGRTFRSALQTFNETDIDPGPVTDRALQGLEDLPRQQLAELVDLLQNNSKLQINAIESAKVHKERMLFFGLLALSGFALLAYFLILDRRVAIPAEQATILSNIVENAEQAAKFGTWEWDSNQKNHYWSPGLYTILNLAKNVKPSYTEFLKCIASSEQEHVRRVLDEARAELKSFSVSARVIQHGGSGAKIIELRGQVQRVNANNVRVSSIIYDITERVSTEDQLALFARMFQHTGEPILISDAQNHIIDVNAAFESHMGYEKSQVLGKDPNIFASNKNTKKVYQTMWAELSNHGFWQGELVNRHKKGQILTFWVAISCIRNQQGELENYIASYSDISELKAAEARIHRLAHHDALTGLLNRSSLESQLNQALLSAHREKQHIGVLFIDLDRFKVINDTLGHHAGDAVLIEVAKRLVANLRESDIIARIGGDEFVVAILNIESSRSLANLLSNLSAVLAEPYLVANQRVISSPSIGVSLYPNDGDNTDTLMKNADTAMYYVKNNGRNNFHFYTEEMNTLIQDKLSLEQELIEALESQQFELYYQPQISERNDQVTGVEALIRWHHPTRGMVPPDSFIPIAEESGLIIQIGQWVLNEACSALSRWRAQGLTEIGMAINISPRQFRAADFVKQVEAALKQHDVANGLLELEITESQAMENAEKTIQILHELKRFNVSIALDDFGTGYSSLAYLKRLPIDVVKVDRSFIKDIGEDINDEEISIAAISLSHNLGLKVVAEGVENKYQRAFLKECKCDLLQGYYFSKPLPETELLKWISDYNNHFFSED
jgi:diguanylate cyclase (GGDEF)-like protein/PAS domain S-box-containing protein